MGNETQWHRDWKNQFPKEWQEVVHIADDGEKHIADIKTPEGLVIEFQHSSIKSEEVDARDAFYKDIIWVVDGSRLKRDQERARHFNWRSFENDGYDIAEPSFLPKNWTNRSVPVFFDFGIDTWLYRLIWQKHILKGEGPVSVTMKRDYFPRIIIRSQGKWRPSTLTFPNSPYSLAKAKNIQWRIERNLKV